MRYWRLAISPLLREERTIVAIWQSIASGWDCGESATPVNREDIRPQHRPLRKTRECYPPSSRKPCNLSATTRP